MTNQVQKTHVVVPMPLMQAIVAALEDMPARMTRVLLNSLESGMCQAINFDEYVIRENPVAEEATNEKDPA